jgi:hypothetical protein
MRNERKVFVCSCGSLEHQVSFWLNWEDDELYLEIHLNNHDNFFKRLWTGLKYAFGYKSKYGHWDNIILDKEKQTELLTELIYSKPWHLYIGSEEFNKIVNGLTSCYMSDVDFTKKNNK